MASAASAPAGNLISKHSVDLLQISSRSLCSDAIFFPCNSFRRSHLDFQYLLLINTKSNFYSTKNYLLCTHNTQFGHWTSNRSPGTVSSGPKLSVICYGKKALNEVETFRLSASVNGGYQVFRVSALLWPKSCRSLSHFSEAFKLQASPRLNFPPPSPASLHPSFASLSTFFNSLYKSPSKQGNKFHIWHSPKKDGNDSGLISSGKAPSTAVILLGWLGAQQKHLRLYADWYNSKGFHVVTFVLPMRDLLGLKPQEKAERHIDALTKEVASWMSERGENGGERCVMFHTFSNTGWLSYGVILEKLLKLGGLYARIKGCVVDSAPEPELNPKVWALGFSAAIMKKRSRFLNTAIASRMATLDINMAEGQQCEELQMPFMEAALFEALVKLFSVVLKLPHINQRLCGITSFLSNNQPLCPQLYIFSDADRVIPSKSVEAFMKGQINGGKQVRACNMKYSPHVDHFRTFPDVYSQQLHTFLDECLGVAY